jgi:hypothetical protein
MQIVSSADELFMKLWLRRHGWCLRDAAIAIAGLLSHKPQHCGECSSFEAIAGAGNMRSLTLHARLRSRLENFSPRRHGAYMVS